MSTDRRLADIGDMLRASEREARALRRIICDAAAELDDMQDAIDALDHGLGKRIGALISRLEDALDVE